MYIREVCWELKVSAIVHGVLRVKYVFIDETQQQSLGLYNSMFCICLCLLFPLLMVFLGERKLWKYKTKRETCWVNGCKFFADLEALDHGRIPALSLSGKGR